MNDQQQFKRNTAFKLRVGEILMGKPIMDGEKFKHLELGPKTIIRVNVIGNIVDKFDSQGADKKYSFFKLDDGSGQISLKAFGDDVDKFKNLTQGLTVTVIGVLRHWNNETYISPEIVKETDPKYLLVRKLETENSIPQNTDVVGVGKEQITAVKDKILGTIKGAEESGGVEMEQIILNLRDIPSHIINQEVQKLLEEGIVFEPRPGKVRYLG